MAHHAADQLKRELKMSLEWTTLSTTIKQLMDVTPAIDPRALPDLLDVAQSHALALPQALQLMNLALTTNNDAVLEQIMAAARDVRHAVFSNQTVVMAPVEVSNLCASDCVFCGWRSSNRHMQRTRQTQDAVLAQVDYLLDLGIDYIELVGGDDFRYVRQHIQQLVPAIRQLMDQRGIRGRICVCSMAVTEEHYRQWKELGVDAMFVWQETYDATVYDQHILSGPKAHGITDHYRLGRDRSGYTFRLDSQERALKAGLEVGLGFMLGLSPSVQYEFLMLLSHVNYLLRLPEGAGTPIILGMPTWNRLTTPQTDLQHRRHRLQQSGFSPVYAALLLLCLPKGRPWVFPTCRIAPEAHVRAVEVAGPFTCTEIKLGPGGYLPRLIRQRQAQGLPTDALMQQLQAMTKNPSDDLQVQQHALDATEQFMHYHHEHAQMRHRLEQQGLAIVDTPTLLRRCLSTTSSTSTTWSDPLTPCLEDTTSPASTAVS